VVWFLAPCTLQDRGVGPSTLHPAGQGCGSFSIYTLQDRGVGPLVPYTLQDRGVGALVPYTTLLDVHSIPFKQLIILNYNLPQT
jgi:hypothetical protein